MTTWAIREHSIPKAIRLGLGTVKKIQFSDGKTWQEYVDQTRLEITCGEAPFVTSRYNPTDGNFIEVKDRIGFLDRKLRVVEENADGDEYKKWSMRSRTYMCGRAIF